MAKMQTFGADDFVFKVGSTTSRDARVASSTYSVPDLFFLAIIVTDQFQNLGLGSRLNSLSTDSFLTPSMEPQINRCFRESMADLNTFEKIIKETCSILGTVGK
jgi:hypothetical protein